MPRLNHETEAIAHFEELARRRGYAMFKGQGAGNRLLLAGNAYFQFGDLRVELPECHAVLEVESAGGLTNLVKYWQCIDKGLVIKPIRLVHLFRQASRDDYRSHLDLWHFLADRMRSALGTRFECHLFTYTEPTTMSLRESLSRFEVILAPGNASPRGHYEPHKT